MNNISKIVAVLETLGNEVSITEIVAEISHRYHIVNDEHLFSAIKNTIEANKQLFKQNASTNKSPVSYGKSEWSKVVTFEKFQPAFVEFLKQADENAITKKSEGSKTPYGFTAETAKDILGLHFGQGAASRTPYMNWYVVSIYYIPETSKIVLGIEEGRYSHLDEMQPLKTEAIGKKDRYVAVFYECDKNNIDYKELYEHFVSVSEQVMDLGL